MTVEEAIAEQNHTAVETFSREHDSSRLPERGVYRDLLPARSPQPGQQYAFEVDLDRCTGCKACVTACHNLNGLDAGETWRSVGTLRLLDDVGGYAQTVTHSCHHCLEPSCMTGCPAMAYDKDPATGIVKHLDDQCIGCGYCTLTCPYDVPQFNQRLGIVRKCDLCSDRLRDGEAPACVQGCPNAAIAIGLVDLGEIAETSRRGQFLPTAPSPARTLPTTRYRTRRPQPQDFPSLSTSPPGEAHPSLIAMLVLSQFSVGLFVILALVPGGLAADPATVLRPGWATAATATGLVAFLGGGFHLGRPRQALRAVLGWRTSWLSREILAFGLFLVLAAAYAGLCMAPAQTADRLSSWREPLLPLLSVLVPAVGALGVACSAMVYAVTPRPLWRFTGSALRFLGSCVVLGCAGALFGFDVTGLRGPNGIAFYKALCIALVFSTVGKVAAELSPLRHLRNEPTTAIRRSAELLVGELAGATAARLACAFTGGVVLPLVLWNDHTGGTALSAGCLILTLAGEGLERLTFFKAAAAPAMPGDGAVPS